MKLETRIADREMGEKARRLAPTPRILLGGIAILPLVDDDWQAVQDMWMLPGRATPMSTTEVRDLADARGLAFDLVT